MKKSIGIDVSKLKLDVCIYDGKEHKLFCCENTESGMKKVMRQMRYFHDEELIVTMEATGTYHLRAATQLYNAGYAVSVVNPLVIKRYGEMKMLRAKTDPVDARLISEYGYDQKPMIFRPKPLECQKMMYILKTIDGFHRIKTQNSNRKEAFRQAPVVPEEAMESLNRINKAIDTEVKYLENELIKLMRERYPEVNKRLVRITGIGNRLASAIIGYFQEFECFENAKQVATYIGVNPSPKESGTTIKGRGAISRKGNKYLRKLFYMAALSASKHNHACSLLYNRLLSEGKAKKVALIAVANKLIRQVFAVVKYQREYDPLYQSAPAKNC